MYFFGDNTVTKTVFNVMLTYRQEVEERQRAKPACQLNWHIFKSFLGNFSKDLDLNFIDYS